MDDPEPRSVLVERRLEKPLLVAALLTIPAIALEQSTTGPWGSLAIGLNWLIWTVFLVEAIIMLRVSEHPGQWLRQHPLEVAIILLTPPFLPASMQAARLFRLLRLLRLLKLAKLVRRLLSTDGIRDTAVLALLTVLGGGAAYSAVEKTSDGQALSAWDGVWWALTTVTTVGYGDSFPQTDAGRMIAIVVMFVGIGFVAVLTAAAAERFIAHRRDETPELHAIQAQLDEILVRLDAIDQRRG